MNSSITINNLQEFEEYCKGKGELVSVHETKQGYYGIFKTKVSWRDGFSQDVPQKRKGEYTVRLARKDCNNQLVLK